MIIGLNNPRFAPGESAAEVAENPFLSEKGVDNLVDSLKVSISGIDCFFDASVVLGHPLTYLLQSSAAQREPSRMNLFSRHYAQFRPIFMRDSVKITPRTKAALVSYIFYGRLALIGDSSPEAKMLDRQFDLLHRAACHKASNPPSTLYLGLPREVDDELLSKVYEVALRREQIVGLATRNRAQISTMTAIAEGKALPIELIRYHRESGEYERKSLYRTREMIAALAKD